VRRRAPTHRGVKPTGGETADERGGFPLAAGCEVEQTLATWGVAVQPGHAGGDEPSFVEEN